MDGAGDKRKAHLTPCCMACLSFALLDSLEVTCSFPPLPPCTRSCPSVCVPCSRASSFIAFPMQLVLLPRNTASQPSCEESTATPEHCALNPEPVAGWLCLFLVKRGRCSPHRPLCHGGCCLTSFSLCPSASRLLPTPPVRACGEELGPRGRTWIAARQ